MADITEATASIREFTGNETDWRRCDDQFSQRFRFDITQEVGIWVRPGCSQERSAAVAALQTLAAKAAELADAIQAAEQEQADD